MYQLLRQYRTTPHTSTKFSPQRLLFGREPGSELPGVSTEDNHDNRAVRAAARENDKQAKQCQKTRGARPNTTLCGGDHAVPTAWGNRAVKTDIRVRINYADIYT